MAITDIDFSEGDNQNFLVELPLGALNAPADVLAEAGGVQCFAAEIPEPTGGGDGDIFIIND